MPLLLNTASTVLETVLFPEQCFHRMQVLQATLFMSGTPQPCTAARSEALVTCNTYEQPKYSGHPHLPGYP